MRQKFGWRYSILLSACILTLTAASHAATLDVATLAGRDALAALQNKTVLLAGASGKNGRVVLRQLTALGIKVRAMTRDVEDARESIGSNYNWVQADVTKPETLPPVLKGVNIIISAVATAMPLGANKPEHVDYEGMVNLSRAGKAAGVTRFVIITSSVSGQKDNFLNIIGNDVLIWKARGEEAIRKSGLEYVIVGPAGISDDPGGVRPIRIFDRARYLRGMMITREDLATVVIASAGLPAAANRVFSVANGTGGAVADWYASLPRLPAQ